LPPLAAIVDGDVVGSGGAWNEDASSSTAVFHEVEAKDSSLNWKRPVLVPVLLYTPSTGNPRHNQLLSPSSLFCLNIENRDLIKAEKELQ